MTPLIERLIENGNKDGMTCSWNEDALDSLYNTSINENEIKETIIYLKSLLNIDRYQNNE